MTDAANFALLFLAIGLMALCLSGGEWITDRAAALIIWLAERRDRSTATKERR